MFEFAQPRRRRRPSLTPMIDVVFLLLVFFMLAARFGQEMTLPLGLGGSGGDWQGAPRLVRIAPDKVYLNGRETDPASLATALQSLMPEPDLPVLLSPEADVDLARLIEILDLLRTAGISQLSVVE